MESFEQRQERAVANIGELLLKGYIMSAEACTKCNCVLFKKTRNSPLFCPICDEETKKENKNNIEKIIKQKNNNLEKELKANNNEIKNNQINVNNTSKNNVNSKMSELLLAGWTLTNDNCPFCVGVTIINLFYTFIVSIISSNYIIYISNKIPLMKNKEKEQFCVKCEKSFISEEEAKKQGMTINNGKIENIKTINDKKEEYSNKIIKHAIENENFLPQSSDKEYVSQPPIKKEKILVDSNFDDVKIECSKTSTALLQQLSSLRKKLELINENNENIIPNMQYTMNICEAITSVVKALNA